MAAKKVDNVKLAHKRYITEVKTKNDISFSERCRILRRGAGSRTRTYEGRSREIYSLLSLPLDDSS